MANPTGGFGFRVYGHIGGAAPDYELEQTYINSSDTALYFQGDLVYRSSIGNFLQYTSSGGGSGGGGLGPAFGVFRGCEFFSAVAGRVVFSPNYPGSVGSNAANGITKAWVYTDPNLLFTCVGGASATGATFVANDCAFNAVCVTSQSSLGNTATGQSAMLLSTTLTANASAPWKIWDLLANRTVSGVPGTDAAAWNQVIVKGNNWERAAGTAAPST